MHPRVACRLHVVGTDVRVTFDITPNVTHKVRTYRSVAQVDATAIALNHIFPEITHSSTRLRAAFLQWVVRARYDAQIAADMRILSEANVRMDVASIVSKNEDETLRKRMCVLDNMATIHSEMVAIARSYRIDNCIMRRRVSRMQQTVDRMREAYDARVQQVQDSAASVICENNVIRLENSSLRRRLLEICEVPSPILYV